MRILGDGGWTIVPVARSRPGLARRRGPAAAAESGGLPAEFLEAGVRVESEHDVAPAAARRRAVAPAVDLEVNVAPGESALVAARLPSGALSFHAAIEPATRRRGAPGRAARALRFTVPVPSSPAGGPARRGLLARAVRLIVAKITEAAIDRAAKFAVGLAAKGGETLLWRARGLRTGWKSVRVRSGSLALDPVDPGSAGRGDRSLLLLHGTFSHAKSAFAGLARGRFFEEVRPLYGDRVFAFDHFTLSDTPEQNVRDLLAQLPPDGLTFDVISHSRGGLVLRHLVERADAFGGRASRFRLGHAVLVASPSRGTPLATPERFEDTIGFVANLIDAFPDNPWTFGPELVAKGIVWVATRVLAHMPGLAAMDARGLGVESLASAAPPFDGAYSALAANYEPEPGLFRRLADAGIDSFFAESNDLVVPTRGGWAIGREPDALPPERVGCFGEDGNLVASSGARVHHLNFFEQDETRRFLLRALSGAPQEVPSIGAAEMLPSRAPLRRGGVPRTASMMTERSRPIEKPPVLESSKGGTVRPPRSLAPAALDDALHLMILGPVSEATTASEEKPMAQIVAVYGSARTIEAFPTRNAPAGLKASRIDPGAGNRFKRIIDVHERIRMALEGLSDSKGELCRVPEGDALRDFGMDLFRSLFVGDVRRLYDVARSERRDRPLDLVLTSNIPWLAALPWEFAFDPNRRKYLATEELHFIRNVLTPVPAARPEPRAGKLRMLVVIAQPLGTQELSTEEETERIRESFKTLLEAGLVDLEVLSDGTPPSLHRRLEHEARRGESFDVVHFIGHGLYDEEAHEGTLLFVDLEGRQKRVTVQTLREILAGRGVQLVFLNACDTARDDRRTLNRGVAQALVEAGLPAVVANQYKVLDPSAVAFAEHFYLSLAQGAALGEAAREARIAVNYSEDREAIDWAVPVIYARDPGFRLGAGIVAAGPSPAFRRRAATSAAHRSPLPVDSPRRTITVSVADLTRSFGALDGVLERLNAEQDEVEFRRVDLVVPLGTWKQSSEKGTPYLDADVFGERLKGKASELGADYLVAFTDRWMTCVEKGKRLDNIYAWWRDSEDQRLILFSVAGFPIEPRGSVTEKLLANALAGGLAAKLLETARRKPVTHPRGPKQCPFYFNSERDFLLLGSRMRFDSRCRRLMSRELPKSLVEALEKMFAAFHGEGDAESAAEEAKGERARSRPKRRRRAPKSPARTRGKVKRERSR